MYRTLYVASDHLHTRERVADIAEPRAMYTVVFVTMATAHNHTASDNAHQPVSQPAGKGISDDDIKLSIASNRTDQQVVAVTQYVVICAR